MLRQHAIKKLKKVKKHIDKTDTMMYHIKRRYASNYNTKNFKKFEKSVDK